MNRIVLVLVSLVLPACATVAPTPPPTAIPAPIATRPNPTATLPPATPLPDAPVSNTPGRASSPSFKPAPGDDKLQRGNAFVDSARLLTLESFPPQFVLALQGSLPTPCHQLRVNVPPPDAKNQIRIEVYSLVNPSVICIQILAPLNVNVPLGSFVKGKYTVLVNGKSVGVIDAP